MDMLTDWRFVATLRTGNLGRVGMWWCICVLQQSCLKIIIYDGSTSIFFSSRADMDLFASLSKNKIAIEFASIVYIKRGNDISMRALIKQHGG